MTSGLIEFEIYGRHGAIVDFYGFEAYNGEEPVHMDSMHNTMRYRCTEGWQTYRSLTQRSFRYLIVQLSGFQGQIKLRYVRCLLRTYPAPAIGRFRCDDERLNRIFEMSRWTARLCSDDVFVDCPTYEQAFWVGDAYVMSLATSSLFGAESLIEGVFCSPRSRWTAPRGGVASAERMGKRVVHLEFTMGAGLLESCAKKRLRRVCRTDLPFIAPTSALLSRASDRRVDGAAALSLLEFAGLGRYRCPVFWDRHACERMVCRAAVKRGSWPPGLGGRTMRKFSWASRTPSMRNSMLICGTNPSKRSRIVCMIAES